MLLFAFFCLSTHVKQPITNFESVDCKPRCYQSPWEETCRWLACSACVECNGMPLESAKRANPGGWCHGERGASHVCRVIRFEYPSVVSIVSGSCFHPQYHDTSNNDLLCRFQRLCKGKWHGRNQIRQFFRYSQMVWATWSFFPSCSNMQIIYWMHLPSIAICFG